MPYKRGNIWYAKVWNKKLNVFKRLACGSQRAPAVALEKKWVDDAVLFLAHPELAKKKEEKPLVVHTISELIDTFKKNHTVKLKPRTQKTYGGYEELFRTRCNGLAVEDIKQQWVDEYVADRMEHISPSTINRELTFMASR